MSKIVIQTWVPGQAGRRERSVVVEDPAPASPAHTLGAPVAQWQFSLDVGASWRDGQGAAFTLPPGACAAGQVQVRQSLADGFGAVGQNKNPLTVDTGAAVPLLRLRSDSGADDEGITQAATVYVLGLKPGAAWQYQIDAAVWIEGTGSAFALTAGQHHYAVRQTGVADTGVAGDGITSNG